MQYINLKNFYEYQHNGLVWRIILQRTLVVKRLRKDMRQTLGIFEADFCKRKGKPAGKNEFGNVLSSPVKKRQITIKIYRKNKFCYLHLQTVVLVCMW